MPNRPAASYSPQNSPSPNFVGTLSVSCSFCEAMRWPAERATLCCKNGKVKLPLLANPPEDYEGLFSSETEKSRHFLNNIRQYNCAFQMTSMGGYAPFCQTGWNPSFVVKGQIYHRISSLLPAPGQTPQFAQIYFVQNDREQTTLRQQIVPTLREDIIDFLQNKLHHLNTYVRTFKQMDLSVVENYIIVIEADKRPSAEHRRRFNLPECSEIAVVLTESERGYRDIVLTRHDGTLHRINECHRSYDALQYLFSNDVLLSSNYQYVVDMYCKVETQRLRFIRREQTLLRAESYTTLRDNLASEVDAAQLGRRVVLLSSFTGSPRYLHERVQDAMTYVRKYHKPDIFTTFTCNPKWREISEALLPNQSSHDRPDLVSRVFYMKLKDFLKDLTKNAVFGKPKAYLYSVEYQKRGLPHAHVLLWLEERIHLQEIDSIVSAEIPSKDDDPELHRIILSHMVHGPCGPQNPRSPCMQNGLCSKRYPREFFSETLCGDKPSDTGQLTL